MLEIHDLQQKMISYFETDFKQISHTLQVHNFCRMIAQKEGVVDEELITLEIAALFHDIGIKEALFKYNSSAGPYQEIEGVEVAKTLLAHTPIKPSRLERILYLIGHHHTYSQIDYIDFQILVEADYIVNAIENPRLPETLCSMRDKYFRTTTGTTLLNNLFKLA